jgi:hypothetical protein
MDLPSFVIGLDLGQVNDPTAIAVLARRVRPTGRTETVTSIDASDPTDAWRVVTYDRPQTAGHYDIVHLERLALGTSYVEVPGRVRKVRDDLRRRWQELAWERNRTRPAYAEDAPIELTVDATGVGRPVVDILREHGLNPIEVGIHGGDQVIQADPDHWRVPKRVLASGVQAAVQSGRLKAAATLPDWSVLRQELLHFRPKISLAGHVSFGATGGPDDWRSGRPNDDLVLAVAIALWWGEYAAERGLGIRAA